MSWMKKAAVAAMAGMLLVAAGCSSGKSSKQVLQDSYKKMAEVQSYTYSGTLGFDQLEVPEAEADEVGAVLDIIKGAKVAFDGQFDMDAKRTDLKLKLEWQADGTSTTLEVPFIVTEESAYLKIPSFPIIPTELTSKFIEIDLKELAEDQGAEIFSQTDKQRELSAKLLDAIINPFEEKEYFSKPKAADVQGLPEGAKYDQLVQFKVTNETFEPALELALNKVVPAVIDLIAANEEYLKLTGLNKENLDSAKQYVADNSPTILEQAKKTVKVNEISITNGLKDDYVAYQGIDTDLAITPEDGSGEIKLDMYVRMQYEDINKKQTFKQEIPTDTMTLDEALAVFGLDTSALEALEEEALQ
ncbi:hypothetical protein [Paenibacillus xylaniclasticus]|uniref:hypothetical protein n=1 Tax=Paenibacillus xylaniclasticus TaxID=588083 RepID=UPI000FDB6B2D|nr:MULTISPECIES: hypothetical protein [Paenibacillus]GFN34194.1 hypothetical protein PCURB6_44540 [Paenibacillus curdlanolyticus]